MLDPLRTDTIEETEVVLSRLLFFFSSRRRHTRLQGDWSSDVCSSDLRILRDAPFLTRPLIVPDRGIAHRDPGLQLRDPAMLERVTDVVSAVLAQDSLQDRKSVV